MSLMVLLLATGGDWLDRWKKRCCSWEMTGRRTTCATRRAKLSGG